MTLKFPTTIKNGYTNRFLRPLLNEILHQINDDWHIYINHNYPKATSCADVLTCLGRSGVFSLDEPI